MATKKIVKKTSTKPSKHFTKKRIILISASVFLLTLLLLISALLAKNYTRYNQAANEAEMVSIRELIINATENTVSDANIDAKTGDTYLTQSRLYIPAAPSLDIPVTATNLRYRFEPTSGNTSVTSKEIINQKETKLYTARNTADMFKHVQPLQACYRGITLSYNETLNDNEAKLQTTIELNNSKTLYVFLDKDCGELRPTIELLKHLRSY